MNTLSLFVVSFVLLVAGCRSHYDETVFIRIAHRNQTLQQRTNIQIEVDALREIVPSFLSVDEGYDIRHMEGTSVICLAVKTESKRTSKIVCKQIAQKYIQLRGGTLVNEPTSSAVVASSFEDDETTAP